MVRITVIWLSVKNQNFFTFQDVKYAYPPHTVNVPFISSHIKYQGRHKNRIYQHDSFTFHVGFSLWFFFFTWSWIQFFFKEMLLVIRNFCIAMSEIELVFRRAERRCSGSLFSMLLFKKLYRMQLFKINCLVTTLYEVFNRLQAFLFKIHNHRKEISSSFVTKEKIIFNRRPKKNRFPQIRLNNRLNINADM